ncbi:MAG: B12-binding domain-containing radical SAM protein, partial [Myxococcota bacterium]|nr:B12-binding domain-containing radical SAM protein [Myxococcota bacterium]
SIFPGELMARLDADFGVVGEGEALGALLDAALGRGVAVAFLRGRLRMRGSPLPALRLLPLLRADG